MMQVADLLAAAAQKAARTAGIPTEPRQRLAVVTCMDSRIDVFGVFALELGDAHVIRNAGGRVTDDVLRSLALSSTLLGIDSVVLMQHTRCGLEGVTDAELRTRTGADLDFLPIDDHAKALAQDVAILAATPFLNTRLRFVAGLLYDLESELVQELSHWDRPS
jgi:carbonic anhydrase